ncbi:sporulation protein [Streptomyces pseudovenezuelae]|uniref:Sporulation-control protein spo0M n=1 Tax=Streptomyces pseudovenezuelae TaxID=67350 RepID=A0ABT6LCL0_9ACTN|nr:sporulation protein [Streptomyces pseudovenezuelae]MDH6213356.1 sporulation-control protein spo0M [Streptomyces pseudovenezuelae]
MGFKRLFGIGDPDEAIEMDTQILGGGAPGGELRGGVVLRGGGRDLEVSYVYLRVLVRSTGYDGEEQGDETDACSAEPSYFTLRKGEEQRLAFAQRLSWETRSASSAAGRWESCSR